MAETKVPGLTEEASATRCIVTPIGLLIRLSGKNPLRLGFDPEAATYWIGRRE
jgi:hypothetical protein